MPCHCWLLLLHPLYLLHPLHLLHLLRAAFGLLVEQVSFVSWLLLWVATGLAVWSLTIYFANVWTHFVAPPKQVQASKQA